MRILCLFVRYGTEAYPDALDHLDLWYERQGLLRQRTLWIIDNQLPPETPAIRIDAQRYLLPGDNSAWEFTAWGRAMNMLGTDIQQFDVIHFVTSAFNTLYRAYLNHFSPGLLPLLVEHNLCLGHMDRYNTDIRIGESASHTWIRTGFFLLPARTAALVSPWAAYTTPSPFFSDEQSRTFRTDAPISLNYQEHIQKWLTGREIGGHNWHSPVSAGPEETRRFQLKAVSIVNEHALSIRLRALGVRLVDFCWLWATHPSVWPSPSDDDQIEARNTYVQNHPPGISETQILLELRRIGFIQPSEHVTLRRIERNRDRSDFLKRGDFQIMRDGHGVYHLAVGWDLAELHTRATTFAANCPTITCPPKLWHRSESLDFLAFEYFNGVPLDQALRSGAINSSAAKQAAEKIVAALHATLTPSDESAALDELATLERNVLSIPTVTPVDRLFLATIAFPFVRRSLLKPPFRRHWTNGDLIPRNVLINAHGEVRLIDYEFAASTHFHAEDWWRWRMFTEEPNQTPDLPVLDWPDPSTPACEALFILRQLYLSHEVLPAAHAVADSEARLVRLIEILAESDASVRDSLALGALIRTAKTASATRAALNRIEPDYNAKLKELQGLYVVVDTLKNECKLLQAQLADLKRNVDTVEQHRISRGQVI